MKGLRNCLRRGLGVTLCPRVAIADDLEAGTMVALPWAGFDDGENETPTSPSPAPYEAGDHEAAVVMIWHQDKWCSPLLRRFMEISKKEMENTYSSPSN